MRSLEEVCRRKTVQGRTSVAQKDYDRILEMDISQKDEKPSKKQQNRTRDGKGLIMPIWETSCIKERKGMKRRKMWREEILLKLNLPDHRRNLKMVVEQLKNFKKDATLKLSKSTNQEWYEHVGPEVTRSQDDKVTRWRNEIMLG
ncbi:hypothetical protein Tco_0145120 [Tanacetum coccineum]